jgi:hypothetical protein
MTDMVGSCSAYPRAPRRDGDRNAPAFITAILAAIVTPPILLVEKHKIAPGVVATKAGLDRANQKFLINPNAFSDCDVEQIKQF